MARLLRLLPLATLVPAAHGFVDTSSWMGSSYTPAAASNSLWWHEYEAYAPAVQRELAAARTQLRISAIRVFLHTLVWAADSERLLTNLDAFLGIAAEHDISVGLVFFDDCWNTHGADLDTPCVPVKGRHNGCWMASPQAVERTSTGLTVKARGKITLVGCTVTFDQVGKPGVRTGKEACVDIQHCILASTNVEGSRGHGSPRYHFRAEGSKEVSLEHCTFKGSSGGEVSVQFPNHDQSHRAEKVSILDCSFGEPISDAEYMYRHRISFIRGLMPKGIVIRGNTFLGKRAIFVNNCRYDANLLLENNTFIDDRPQLEGQPTLEYSDADKPLHAINGVLIHVCGSPGLGPSDCNADRGSAVVFHADDCKPHVEFDPQHQIGSSEEAGGDLQCDCTRCGDFRDWGRDWESEDSLDWSD